MTYRVFVLLMLVASIAHGQPRVAMEESYIDPTGTYTLKGKKYRGEIKGNYGEIRVKLLDSSLIAMSFYSNKGFPGYEQAGFTDTLAYRKNLAVYIPNSDPGCRLIFDFFKDGVRLRQIYRDPLSTCGFGSGVIGLGFVPKSSLDVPVIQNLLRPS